jgi:hypothetical protein
MKHRATAERTAKVGWVTMVVLVGLGVVGCSKGAGGWKVERETQRSPMDGTERQGVTATLRGTMTSPGFTGEREVRLVALCSPGESAGIVIIPDDRQYTDYLVGLVTRLRLDDGPPQPMDGSELLVLGAPWPLVERLRGVRHLVLEYNNGGAFVEFDVEGTEEVVATLRATCNDFPG